MPAGTVEVFLIGATGIKDTEVFGKADPYAILYCGKQKLRSNTASNQGSKPVWNQKFSFYIDDTAVDLQIRIFNHNIFKEDDELGSTKIPLTKVFAESKLPTTTYNVVRPSGRVQGEVKLSIAFTAKYKTGQQPPQNLPGPYNSKVHGSSPYKATPPTPPEKHDPLTGPYGYFKSADSISPGGSSHGKIKTHSFASDSDLGSSKPYPPVGMYPPVPAANATSGRYQHTDSFNREDSTSSSSFGSSHGRPYPAAPAPPSSSDYTGSVYHESPYGHGPHGVGGPTAAYHATAGGHDASYPPHSGGNPYDRVDDLSGRFGNMNVSLNDPHGSFSGYHSMPSFSNDRPPSGYPPHEPATSDQHHYPPPPPGQPGGGYPPPPPPHGYAPQGYPPQFNSGSGGYPGSHSFHGYQAPPASFYPPELGVPQQPYGRSDSGDPHSSNAYPPAPYYNAPPPHYVPAGYPK